MLQQLAQEYQTDAVNILANGQSYKVLRVQVHSLSQQVFFEGLHSILCHAVKLH